MPEKTKKYIRASVVGLLYAYLLGIVCSVPYFNYQYARSNGFVAWLFFGEIVPSLKGVVWPVFAVRSATVARVSPTTVDAFHNSMKHYHSLLEILKADGPGQ